MCAQCVAKRRAWQSRRMGKGEVEEGEEQQQNVDQPHYALYSMENLFITLRVSLLLFAGRLRTPIGLPTTPAWHPSSPLPRPCTTPRLTQPPYSPSSPPPPSPTHTMCCCRTILRFPFEVVSLCQFYFAVWTRQLFACGNEKLSVWKNDYAGKKLNVSGYISAVTSILRASIMQQATYENECKTEEII